MHSIQSVTVPRHPIRVVSERTGLSTDVLRAWQKRYGAVEPGRTESGQRLYSDADIERLRLIAEAVRAGRNVASVANLSIIELTALLREDKADKVVGPVELERIIMAAMTLIEKMDSDQLELHLRRALMARGVDSFLEGVLSPLLTEVGNAWARGELSPAHEHMASAVVRRVLEWVIGSCETATNAPLVVLTTPSGELHELGALLAATAAALEGWRIRYLGPNLPAEDVALAVEQSAAHAVAISAVSMERAEVTKYFAGLAKSVDASVPVFGGGAAMRNFRINGVQVFSNLADFRTELAVVKAAVPA